MIDDSNIDILQYQPYVHKILHKMHIYEKDNPNYFDCFQSGMIGLQKAKNKYNPNDASGASFFTFCYWSIKREVQNYLIEMSRVISYPCIDTLYANKHQQAESLDIKDKGDDNDLNSYDVIVDPKAISAQDQMDNKFKQQFLDELGEKEFLHWLYKNGSEIPEHIKEIIDRDYPEYSNRDCLRLKHLLKCRMQNKLLKLAKINKYCDITTPKRMAKMKDEEKRKISWRLHAQEKKKAKQIKVKQAKMEESI